MLRSDLKLTHVHRARRTLATAATCAGVALGIVALTGVAAAAPLSLPDAAASSFAAPAFRAAPSSVATSPTLEGVVGDADAALTRAQATLADAATVESDIQTAGLPLAVGDASVDTSALEAATDRLSSSDLLPVVLVPALSQNASSEAERVAERVAVLRGSLNDAVAAKEAADAAAEAQRQAEAAAAAEAQRQKEAAEALARVNTPEGAKEFAQSYASEQYGWGSDQFSCLVSLWTKESGWNYQAYNPSGATGIPQSLPGSKMATFGDDWQTNAATQIKWGLDYISRGYGTPCSAWAHSQATDWY
ncbi:MULTISPECIES: phospholipase [unclassified Microbacterium]|uniref:aggregation-promoting factor C-terminal-like domain-containing protein n=1 Tax=unclassified Microbacterium TaxID=2609290 RepID=UPI0009F85B7B|nr:MULTISPECIES: phospholipase [unclassified Microbacterium]MXS73172.1 phospholipase [Microbacterium sp. TL13]